MRTLTQSVLEDIRRQELLRGGDRVGAAVSGGADSVALLRLLVELRRELGVVLSVVHFNHKLRAAEADADEEFVRELARRHKLELHCASGDVTGHAAAKRLSVETAARQARYQYFWRLLRENHVNRIATAHTLDDQAETLLLKLARGAGTQGLAGIYPRLAEDGNAIVRPLLKVRRKDLEEYLVELGQNWREDSSNQDLHHARNRVRHEVLPQLERALNPAVREALATTAEIARGEEEYWESEVKRVLPPVWQAAAKRRAGSGGGSLSLDGLRDLPLALQRRVVRAAAETLGLRLEFKHVEEILAAVSADAPANAANLPGAWVARRKQDELWFEPVAGEEVRNSEYDYALPVPGRIEVPETGTWFEAALVPNLIETGYNPENLLNPELLAKDLRVRNWRAGDRFWPAHTKGPKKIKELLQERHLTGDERRRWPVVASGTDVVWVRGFAGAAQLRPPREAEQAVVIQERPSKVRNNCAAKE